MDAYAQAHQQVHPRGHASDTERDADAFLNWLATTDHSWIVVLDDLADPAELTRLWPTGPAGQVITTTRRRDAAISARGPVVDIGVFTPGQSLSYLAAKLVPERGGAENALRGAGELAAALDHLPLALAQAAAVIIDDGVTCADYLGLLGDRARRLADLFPSDPQAAGDEYERTLAGTWSLAADRADAMPPHQLARPLLRLAAVLDPNGIPEAVLTAPAAVRYLGGEESAANARARSGTCTVSAWSSTTPVTRSDPSACIRSPSAPRSTSSVRTISRASSARRRKRCSRRGLRSNVILAWGLPCVPMRLPWSVRRLQTRIRCRCCADCRSELAEASATLVWHPRPPRISR